MEPLVELYGAVDGTEISPSELPKYLAQLPIELPVYRKIPLPGHIYGASFDWFILLGKAADVITAAGALWAAYQWIKGHNKVGGEKSPKFIIQAKLRSGPFENITIEGTTTEKEFMIDFVRRIANLNSKTESTDDNYHLTEYANSGRYERIVADDNWSPSNPSTGGVRAKPREDT
ncbi:MAG: glycoside hydrolase family 28 protein [Desulfarculaceae bacterium]|nr:glycoside hydrolase family 28 protein [Desulfarculaceae bacterium]MCF8071995.1 glycoside hydrolase family 28 protein [Desulfarculaceae bacterium]MCF8101512.1 glycoside hydrolase family 28 protein [Desulfarculaceae bacterium]MCF8115062.1 glycoside hydrolase family 28 protein [Desulfarculaceae bacterium]